MPAPIIIVDSSDIREGKLDDLKRAMDELPEFVETNEPWIIAYDVYLNDTDTEPTVVQAHPDSASAELHMKVAGPVFRQFGELLTLSRIDI